MKTNHNWMWLLVLHGAILIAPAHAVESAATGNCKIACQQTLAQCEQKKGVRAHCPRTFQQCTENCETPVKKDQLSKKQRKRVLCEQRCDLNRNTCETANVGNAGICAAGQKGCRQRCD